jgi:hypothetical protein
LWPLVSHEFQKDHQAAEPKDQSHGDANYNDGSLSKGKITRHDILPSRSIGRQARSQGRLPDSFTFLKCQPGLRQPNDDDVYDCSSTRSSAAAIARFETPRIVSERFRGPGVWKSMA